MKANPEAFEQALRDKARAVIERSLARQRAGEYEKLVFLFFEEIGNATDDEAEQHYLGFYGEKILEADYGLSLLTSEKE